MTLTEILEFVLLPCVGYLLLNSSKNAARLSRIETLLEIFISKHRNQNQNENEL